MSIYRRDGSDFWWASVFHNGQRVRESLGTTDRKEAQRLHDELKARLWQVEPAIKGRTWGKAVDLWCDAAERSESELLSLAKFGKNYPDRLLTKVSADSLDAALNTFCTTPGTYTRYRNMINAILNLAKEKGWLREAPLLKPKRAKKQKARVWITHEQWDKLHAELPRHMKPMARFAVTTGLRQANVLGLTWDRVDLERSCVWVEGEDMKAGKAVAVPLSDEARTLLEAHLESGAALGFTKPGEHVFTYRGKPVKEIKTAFMAACVRAGVGSIDDKGRYGGFTWHGLRHTWATWHVQNGTPLEVLQKLGGWADLRMVMNYAHHSPGHLAGFANNAARKK